AGRGPRSRGRAPSTLTRQRSAERTFGSGDAFAAERVNAHPVPCAAASDGMTLSATAASTAARGTLPGPDRMTWGLLPDLLPGGVTIATSGRGRRRTACSLLRKAAVRDAQRRRAAHAVRPAASAAGAR